MNAPRIYNRKVGPEAEIQEAIIKYLRFREWYVMETHGNMYQKGLPDLYATHRKYGIRWIEVKQPSGYSFTPAQLDTFPLLTANGTGIWILSAASDTEYAKLWAPANWHVYLMLMNQRSAH